jgi:nitronate monooxygenase
MLCDRCKERLIEIDHYGERLTGCLLGHDPEDISREAVANEDGRPIYKFSTVSPLRITTGDLECLALFAGQVVGEIETIPSAGARISEMAAARATLVRLGTSD